MLENVFKKVLLTHILCNLINFMDFIIKKDGSNINKKPLIIAN